MLCGARFTTSYARIGGLQQDWTPQCTAMLNQFLGEFKQDLEEVEKLLRTNRIFIDRCENVGRISREDAIALGLTGPLLRAAGVPRDLRRDDPYLVYPELDFDVITLTESDALARFYVRIAEMKESAKILRQALDNLPDGPYHAARAEEGPPAEGTDLHEDGGADPRLHADQHRGSIRRSAKSTQGVESSKGELGFYIVSRRHRTSVADEDPLPVDDQPFGASPHAEGGHDLRYRRHHRQRRSGDGRSGQVGCAAKCP